MTVWAVSYTHLTVCHVFDGNADSDPFAAGADLCGFQKMRNFRPVVYAAFTPVSYTHLDVYKRQPFLYANACEDAEALGFDKDLTFFTFPRASASSQALAYKMCIRDR